MQAIFLHSVDEIFEPVGHKLFIQYLKLFSAYKQIIMTKLITQEEDHEIKDMIAWYNPQVLNCVRGHPIPPCIPDSSNLCSSISFNTLPYIPLHHRFLG